MSDTSIGPVMALPSLGPGGWLTDPAAIADRVLAYFFSSNVNQTYLFNNRIYSAQACIAYAGSNMRSLCSQMEQNLTKLFHSYFNTVRVTVTTDEATNKTSAINVTVDIQFVAKGQTYAAGNVIGLANGRFNTVQQFNNFGTFTMGT